MTANQASPAHAGLPAPPAATARPHDPAGHPAAGRRPPDLPLAAVQKKTALYAPVLLGPAAAAVLALAGPAMASPVTGQDAAGTVSFSPILSAGDPATPPAPGRHNGRRWRRRLGTAATAGALALAAGPVAAAAAATTASQSARAQLGASRTVEYWGSLSGGPIPIKPVNTTLSPAPLRLPGPVAQVATSNSTEYVLLANGSVYARGLGNHGQLGDGTTRNSFTTPVRVRFPAGVKIAFLPIDVMPFDTALAVDTTGHVWGWGVNGGGELCLGNRQQHLVPVELPFSDVTAVAGAFSHAVYDSAGQVFACGLGKAGVLGNGTTKSSFVPVKVTGLGPSAHVVELVAAFANAGARLADGTYLDWGINGRGQLGTGSAALLSDVPVKVPLPAGVVQVTQGGSAPGNGQTLVLLTNGALYAWGADNQGQLGDGKTTPEFSPVPITPPSGVSYQLLASSGSTSYGVTAAGDVYAWGGGGAGQIGNGTTASSLTPVKVASDATGISGTAFDVIIALGPQH